MIDDDQSGALDEASVARISAELAALRKADPPTHGGRVLSYVYDHGQPLLDELVRQAVAQFLPVNGLDPTTFTSVAVLERDLVAFTRSVLSAESDVVGSVTSGGTESCLLAVKAARDYARQQYPGTNGGAIVMPVTAHAAFRKAAHYLGLTTIEVPVDPATGTLEASEFVRVLHAAAAAAETGAGPRPILAVLSAPCYPYGALDPIAEVAQATERMGLWLHVDACIGGWLLPWWPEFDAPWDFRLPGVSSISTDLHKYGYAPKGASVILYRGRERHLAQYFATADWPGYPVVNPTMLGSKSATALAAAWAVTKALGAEGYRELVAKVARATQKLVSVVGGIEGLELVGEPAAALLAMRADPAEPPARQVDPFLLVDALARRGFIAQDQPGLAQAGGAFLPRTAHITVTPVTEDIAAELCDALIASANEVRGRSAPGPDPSLVARVAAEGLPTELAGVMSTLEHLDKQTAAPALSALLAGAIDPDRGGTHTRN